MSLDFSFKKLALVGAAAALLAACSDTSISSPGATNPGTPPGGGGGGGGGSSATPVNLVPSGACPTNTRLSTVTTSTAVFTACEITGNIFTDTTLPGENGYVITGPVFVGQDGGANAVLTIGAGATFFGAAGSDYIVVTRGSRIEANGTVNAPIRFTSRQALDAEANGNPRAVDSGIRGEWGGLVINGFAPINACIDGSATGGTAGCEKSGEGSSGLFGGGNPNDNSGTLNYVRVEYAGFRLSNDDELNGIAFQGVGNGTAVDFIQVHNNADDGVEFFGGTVNASHIVLTGNGDDSFDYTDGWVGNAQFVVVSQEGSDADQGFEFDNRSSNNDLLPRSNPNISNFTLRGVRDDSSSDIGMLLRAGTAGYLFNGIVFDFNENCLDVDDASTHTQANQGNLSLESIFLDCPTNFATDADGFDEAAFFNGSTNAVAGTNTMAGFFPGPTESAVPAVDPTGVNAFFQAGSFLGAFSPTETPASNWAAGWTVFLLPDAGCPTGTTESNETTPQGGRICTLTGNVTSDLRLTRGNTYELVGPVFIGVDRGPDPANPLPSGIAASLTIDPGVTIFGSTGSDYIVVTRGSTINSNGTVNAPVVMSSRTDIINGTNTEANRGQWGGLVINGRAPINACIDGTATGGTTDCEKSGEGSSGLFGGATNDDDSGQLFYTRVQYAGFRLSNDDELNGIAFQGVGNQTEVDFIQVHNNADDGVEMFGGTVNVSHVILTGNGDDSFDYTDGWVGRAQFVIVQHTPSDADQGFEFDNRGSNNDLLPRSNPIISNFTLIGVRDDSSSDTGMLLRAGTAGRFVNGVVTDFNADCLDVDDASTHTLANQGDLVIQSTLFDCPTNFSTDGDGFDEAAFFSGGTNNVATTTTLTGPSLVALSAANVARGLVPGSAEQAVTAIDPSTLDPFFTSVNYIGAVEDANDTWFQGWSLVTQ